MQLSTMSRRHLLFLVSKSFLTGGRSGRAESGGSELPGTAGIQVKVRGEDLKKKKVRAEQGSFFRTL